MSAVGGRPSQRSAAAAPQAAATEQHKPCAGRAPLAHTGRETAIRGARGGSGSCHAPEGTPRPAGRTTPGASARPARAARCRTWWRHSSAARPAGFKRERVGGSRCGEESQEKSGRAPAPRTPGAPSPRHSPELQVPPRLVTLLHPHQSCHPHPPPPPPHLWVDALLLGGAVLALGLAVGQRRPVLGRHGVQVGAVLVQQLDHLHACRRRWGWGWS